MPQMSSLMWFSLLIVYLLCLQHMSILIAFFSSPKIENSSSTLPSNFSKFSWLW